MLPSDFSLVLGGPLYQLYVRSRILKPPLDLVQWRAIVIAAVAWLPLLVLSLIGRSATGGAVALPFLHDIETHVRFLIALPILILAEIVVHQRIRPVVEQFVDRGIVVPEEVPAFHAAIASALRLRNSVAAEVGLIVLIYTVGHWVWREQIALHRATWYGTPDGAGVRLTLSGYWYAFVSIPIFQLILLRWYLRLFVWFSFLWRVSRLKLRLIPTHPDRAAGLGFVGVSAYAFEPVLFAQGAMLAGLIASRVFYEGQNLLTFKVDAAGFVAFFVLFMLAPLVMFTPLLVEARRRGLREYGVLASRHAQEFDDKWIRGGVPAGELLVGNPDISSWADFDSGYETVRDMRPVPFGLDAVIRLAAVTAAPLLPLTLTIMPFEEVVTRLIKVLL